MWVPHCIPVFCLSHGVHQDREMASDQICFTYVRLPPACQNNDDLKRRAEESRLASRCRQPTEWMLPAQWTVLHSGPLNRYTERNKSVCSNKLNSYWLLLWLVKKFQKLNYPFLSEYRISFHTDNQPNPILITSPLIGCMLWGKM